MRHPIPSWFATPTAFVLCFACSGGSTGRGGGDARGGAPGSAGGSPGSNGGASTTSGGALIGFGGSTAATGGAAGVGGACADPVECRVGCGNGRVEPPLGEVCDDGNSQPADGCSADCKAVESDFACPQPGKACVNLVHCGDGKLGGAETCDDGNVAAGDGCAADCKLESGWDCPLPAASCVPRCGDGVLLGAERCELPNVGKGCTADCRLETGFVCDAPKAQVPAVCHATKCGDTTKEGAEACDDGNVVDGDGCSAACTLEPICTGTCTSKCGDRLKLPPEECDDGNTQDGDGCSGDCRSESGFTCKDTVENPPARLNLAVTYRDFISFPLAPAVRHPDFQADLAGDRATPLLVKPTLSADGKPQMDGRCSDLQPASIDDPVLCPFGRMLTSQSNFDAWYHDTAGVNVVVPGALLLPRLANGSYVYDSAPAGFYPLDGKGFLAPPVKELTEVADPVVNDGLAHDFGFSTEIRYFFQYRGGEALAFSGDDDLWIFVNRRLALDVGGLHPRTAGSLNVDAMAAELGLSVGSLYEIALFHAERHAGGSNFKLTLTGFTPVESVCAAVCGDAVVVSPEQCDLGAAMNTGTYGGCTAQCRRGPYCGDRVVQPNDEACDDGTNLSTYGVNGAAGCAPGCVKSGFCGDARLDALFGEQCDLGQAKNTGEYGTCTADCQLAPRCGDGKVQTTFGETCDDSNTVSGDGCGHDCKPDVR